MRTLKPFCFETSYQGETFQDRIEVGMEMMCDRKNGRGADEVIILSVGETKTKVEDEDGAERTVANDRLWI